MRRVRNINGITQHKLVLRNDIKMAAKLIQALDERGGLWSHKPDEEGQTSEVRGREGPRGMGRPHLPSGGRVGHPIQPTPDLIRSNKGLRPISSTE